MLLKLITEGSFTLAEALFTLAASTPYTVLGYIFVLLFVLFFLLFILGHNRVNKLFDCLNLVKLMSY